MLRLHTDRYKARGRFDHPQVGRNAVAIRGPFREPHIPDGLPTNWAFPGVRYPPDQFRHPGRNWVAPHHPVALSREKDLYIRNLQRHTKDLEYEMEELRETVRRAQRGGLGSRVQEERMNEVIRELQRLPEVLRQTGRSHGSIRGRPNGGRTGRDRYLYDDLDDDYLRPRHRSQPDHFPYDLDDDYDDDDESYLSEVDDRCRIGGGRRRRGGM